MTDIACKYKTYCWNYKKLCDQCKHGWTSKLKNMHDTKEGQAAYAFRHNLHLSTAEREKNPIRDTWED